MSSLTISPASTLGIVIAVYNKASQHASSPALFNHGRHDREKKRWTARSCSIGDTTAADGGIHIYQHDALP
eukprot:scaffold131625_cov38-Prasinocladus_malaysianus.AAC.2